jgi:hypothetical protein
MPISRFAFTQCVAETTCPKCQAGPGQNCRTPKGRKAWPPHGERGQAYHQSIGATEFARRHSFAIKRPAFLDAARQS